MRGHVSFKRPWARARWLCCAVWHARAVLNYCAPSILIPEKNLSPHPSASLLPSHIHSEPGRQHSHGDTLLASWPLHFLVSMLGGPVTSYQGNMSVSLLLTSLPISKLSPSPLRSIFLLQGPKMHRFSVLSPILPSSLTAKPVNVSARLGDYVFLLSSYRLFAVHAGLIGRQNRGRK